MNSSPQPTLHAPSRHGFTLLELMVVIVIIGILLSLILPTIGGAMRRVREAEVATEMTRLETAITSFKSDFNIEPWSKIELTEDPSVTPWPAETRTRLRRLWPDFTFAGTNDFNGDGDTDDALTLEGSECLVFFLGGMRSPEGTLTGFSKNPINPFVLTGETRQGPYYDFDSGRLVDTDNDGMFEYIDTLPDQSTPLHFVSSNNGQGYSKSDGALNFYVEADGQTALKKSSHQIISPGEDGEFGFNVNASPFVIPADPTDPNAVRVFATDTDFSSRPEERDNIANFGPSGRLEP